MAFPNIKGINPSSLVGATCLLGSVSLAATANNVVLKSLHERRLQDKIATSIANPHGEFNNYLDQMRSYLQTPPRDLVFGADRIPNIHGKNADNLPAFKAIKSLQGTLQVRSAVVGFQPVRYSEDSGSGHMSEYRSDDSIRICPVHLLSPDRSLAQNGPNLLEDDGSDAFSNAWDVGYDSLKTFAKELKNCTKEVQVKKIDFLGNPGWIMAKPVRASVSSCYGCHKDVKKGQPIGYVLAMITKD